MTDNYTIKTKIIWDNDPDDPSFSCEFIFTIFPTTISMYYFEPYLCSSQQWMEMADNLDNKNFTGSLEFCNSNGLVYITLSKGKLVFSVSKHGAGGDGCITIAIIPNPQVVDAFKGVAENVKKYKDLQNLDVGKLVSETLKKISSEGGITVGGVTNT